MPKETIKEKMARSQSRTMIVVALISSATTLLVGVLTAFLAFPPFQEWVRSRGQGTTAQPPTSAAVQSDLSIEQFPRELSVFDGSDEQPGRGTADFMVSYNLDMLPTYDFIYDLPSETYGGAGLRFLFPGGINLSDYESLDFTIQYCRENEKILLFLIDENGVRDSLAIPNSGTEAAPVSFLLSRFRGINLNGITEIHFFAQTDEDARTDENTGYHDVVIQNIHFVK